jgi:urease accessory protein
MQTSTKSAIFNRVPARAIGALMLATAAPLTHAHHPMGGVMPSTFSEGLLSGFGHPIIGIDHFAFLIVVGLLSVSLTGAVRYLVPAMFVAGTVGGTLYHLGAADLPMVETMIALSVLLGGMAVLLKRNWPALVLGALSAAMGVFHGYAYGEAVIGAENTPLLAYLFGFSLIQFAVIVAVIKITDALARRSTTLQSNAVRLGGLATAATGAIFLGMNLS